MKSLNSDDAVDVSAIDGVVLFSSLIGREL